MGRLRVAVSIAILWCALSVHAAGVVLAPPLQEESANQPPGNPFTEDQIACIIAAIDADLDPAVECEL